MYNKQKPSFRYKFLIVGDSGVGKTSLLMRYSQNEFHEEFLSTVGVDFKVKKLETTSFTAQVHIWDTAGQERFRNITKSFYRGSHGIILAYSVTDPLSHGHITSWITQIQSHCDSKSVCFILVGCKSDLEEERKVSYEDGVAIGVQYGIPFLEVSAKMKLNVEQTFETLTNMVHEKCSSQPIPLKLKATKKEKCCG